MMRSLALLVLLPFVTAQLNTAAKAVGKHYFGSATDNPELTNTQYVSILSNTADFGQLTAVRVNLPASARGHNDFSQGNSMKWVILEVCTICW